MIGSEVGDHGIMIGTCSLPSAPSQWMEFFELEIHNNIFDKYKRGIYEFSFRWKEDDNRLLSEFNESIFVPIPFYLIDSNRLFFLSIVDDFEFATKKHSISDYSNYYATEILDDDEDFFTRSFSINTELGQKINGERQDPSIVNRTRRENSYYPLLVVCRLKIDDALLIGCDQPLRHEAEAIIREKIETHPSFESKFDYLLISSFGWHEFSLLFFCTDYKITQGIIDELVSFRMKSLMVRNEDLYQEIASTSLMSEWLSNTSDTSRRATLEDLPLFSYARTQFGFSLLILEYVLQKSAPLPVNYLKPSDAFVELLGKEIQPGISSQALENNSKITKVNNEILPFLDLYFKTKLVKIKEWAKQIFEIPSLLILQTWRNHEEQKLLYFENIERYTFTENDLFEIKTICRRLRVNTNEVVGMFTTYNQYVRSPLLYRSFIRLRPFLRDIWAGLKYFEKAKKGSIEDVKNQLASWSLTFQKILGNLTDRLSRNRSVNSATNLDFWQIQKLMDSHIKVQANSIFLPFEEGPVLVLDNVDEISFSGSAVQVGANFLIQPSLFLSGAMQVITSDFLLRTAGLSGIYGEFHSQTARLFGRNEELPFLATEQEVDAFLGALFSYYVTFNRNSDLFLFWYWHKFMQQPGAYQQNGEIDENLFVSFLIRMMVLMDFVDHEGEFFHSKLIAPFPELQTLWFRWFTHIRVRVDEILKNNPVQILKSWFDQAKGLIINEVIPKLYTGALEHGLEDEVDVIAAYRQIREKRGQPLAPTSTTSIKEQIARDWYAELDAVTRVVLSELEKGHVFKLPRNHHYSSSFYLQALSLAYLRLIRNLFKEEHTILYRSPASSMPSPFFDPIDTRFQRKYGPLVFDSRGGLFTTSFTIRRIFFKVRVAYLKSISWVLYEQEMRLFSDRQSVYDVRKKWLVAEDRGSSFVLYS